MLKKDLIILKNLLKPRFSKGNHADQMEAFYAEQAEGYDEFRERLLHGRPELFRHIDWSSIRTWVDMGAGTGYNLKWAPMDKLQQVELVDLSSSLLKVAQARIEKRAYSNTKCIHGDATTYRPAFTPDLITFNYSLSMIPRWQEAIDHAIALLPSGGLFGATDFYAELESEAQNHGWLTRNFWPLWFSYDGVYLKRGTLAYLKSRLETVFISEQMGTIPYIPTFAKAPYYVFIGRKR